jgi:N-acetylmuramoyl-L-alanine amidase
VNIIEKIVHAIVHLFGKKAEPDVGIAKPVDPPPPVRHFGRVPVGTPPLTPPDLDILTRTLSGEAAQRVPDALQGIKAIVHVVRNRAIHMKTDAATECLRRLQFSCWNLDDPNRARIKALSPVSAEYQKLRALAEDAWDEADITGGALHYYNPSIASPAWRHEGRETLRVAGHSFRAGVKWLRKVE